MLTDNFRASHRSHPLARSARRRAWPCALAVVAVIAGVALARPAAALDLGDPDSSLEVEVHGFVSQGFAKSTDNDYLLRSSKGSFEMSEAGLNFTSQLTERLRVGIQLFAYDLGTLGNYTARADWFYLDYRLKDWLGPARRAHQAPVRSLQ